MKTFDPKEYKREIVVFKDLEDATSKQNSIQSVTKKWLELVDK